ncbi:hypothetical protein [Paenibacillus pseudetheri]|jgi:hypothetical protein|uniref:Uncharacterized protein n=1 Tax=Paenibacillus pseudetheri TaxID=2897682 RepID=A0ABM9BKN3_9BACL|nr:hypothetical protein [Paenibacillus pseudetheri]CAH1059728.1 hypothetical protein PAECIP111894_05940 [Paenibacillus pseudetheri]
MKKLAKASVLITLIFLIVAPTSFAGYFDALNQDVTAYTASQLTASGASRYTHSGQGY